MRKTKTADEDDEIEESRMFGTNTFKSFGSKLFGGAKNAGAADDAVVNAANKAAAKADDVGGGVKNGAKKADDVGDDALNAAKKGGEVAKVAKKGWSKKKKAAWAITVIAGVLGALTIFAYTKAQGSEKMTALEPLTASQMGSMAGSAEEITPLEPLSASELGSMSAEDDSTGSDMDDSSSRSNSDDSSGSDSDGSSGLGLGSMSDPLLDELMALGVERK